MENIVHSVYMAVAELTEVRFAVCFKTIRVKYYDLFLPLKSMFWHCQSMLG